jgi:hypothetical protein
VRKLLPSVRALVLSAAAPALVGVSAEELPAALGFEKVKDLESAYNARAKGMIASGKGGGLGASLFGKLGKDRLAEGLAQVQGADGDTALWHLVSSVEQTAALVCNLLAAAQEHEAAVQAVRQEQDSVLKGTEPKAPITPALLAEMPVLDAFVRETLRVYPPARPARLVLTGPVDGAAGTPALAAGTVVAAEPFVAHFSPAAYGADAERFDPARFADAGDDAPQPLLPFATAAGDTLGEESRPAGERLAVSMAKVCFVQLLRMYKIVKLGVEPPPLPSGFPLHTVSGRVEALFEPKMYYELERGAKTNVIGTL